MAVTGIGGFFFRARDPEALGAWYRTHFGITAPDEAVWNQQAGPTVFMPFAADTDYFAGDKQFMINIRVDDIDALLPQLRQAGIEVLTDASWDAPETGRFARVHDPEGNAVEIWEPPPE
ncbi:MAG TPA: VOC family protein [Candidatus Binatia bacterium]|nr:VOC family protein [Candidatus Binatia bacterium]